MELTITTNAEQLPKLYLQILNGIFRLSDKEMEIVSEAMKIDNEFGDKVKRHLRQKFGFDSQTIANYVQKLKKKKILVVKEGVTYISPKVYIKPNEESSRVVINFKLNG
jgi:hypothetical protein